MRLRHWFLSLPFVVIAVMLNQGTVGQAVNASSQAPDGLSVARQLAQVPTAFTKNEGQWDERVLYRTAACGATIWFTREGIMYQFTRRVPREGADPHDPMEQLRGRFHSSAGEEDSVEVAVIHATFVDPNPDLQIDAEGMLDYKCNYFLGHDPSQWRTNVRNYTRIVYRDIQPGVDGVFEVEAGKLRTRWEAKPGASLARARFKYKGDIITGETDEDDVIVQSPWGATLHGRRETASSADSAVTLEYSTFLEGGSWDYGNGIAVGLDGSVYVSGETASADFPTLNPLDGSYEGTSDAYITKLAQTGDALVYSTFLGGSNEEYASGISVDTLGYAYVTGETQSADFPMENPYQASYNGSADAFAVKLSRLGDSLVFSTFIGGSERDAGFAVASDVDGNTYVTGVTVSGDFPYKDGYDWSFNGGNDAFVSKLSPTGDLAYSTFLGGTDSDMAFDIVVDTGGSAYVTGITQSSGFPTTHNGNLVGAGQFVTKLTVDGTALEYSTVLVGGGGIGLTVDAVGSAYVTGFTYSSDYPTVNSYQSTYNGGGDAYVTKLSQTGDSLIYSTFLGGSGYDQGFDVAVDIEGGAYVTGFTHSTDFPTQNPYDASSNGEQDVFVAKLSAAGNALIYSTYLGGSSNEAGLWIAVDTAGAAYVTGPTYSYDFPTRDAYDSVLQGGSAAFVAKLSDTAMVNQPGYTPVGDSVDVGLTDSVQIFFSQVTAPGVTTVTVGSEGPQPPVGFAFDTLGSSMYFDVQTTAVFSGPVILCFTFAETNLSVPEHLLRIFHYEIGGWEDITVLPVDSAANQICGSVSSLSPFAIGWPLCACPWQADLNASGAIDAVDLAIHIDIVFFASPDIQDSGCLRTRADLNNDGVADAVDVALLIDHVFFGGPGPVDPCTP